MPKYFISGVIQIEVTASDAVEAVQRAQCRAATLEKSPTIVIGLDNIATDGHASVALEDAAVLDETRDIPTT